MRLNEIMDKVRINKYGISNAALISWGILASHSRMNSAIYTVGLLTLFPMIVSRQNKSYDRLINALENHGYDERICSEYMKTPCGRSIVKNALKRKGLGENYKTLRTKYPLSKLF